MLLPTILLLGNSLALAPAPQTQLHLPPGDGEAKWHTAKTGHMDQNGDPLPEGAIARIGTVRFHAANNKIVIAFSADGRTLALCCPRSQVVFLEVTSGKELPTVPQVLVHGSKLPSGKLIATPAA